MYFLALDVTEFVINNVASFILGFISLYLALWVQAQAEEKKEREQYLDDLKSFLKESKKNAEKKLSGTFASITQYEKTLDDSQELFDDLSRVASDEDTVKDKTAWFAAMSTIFQRYGAEYQQSNNATVESLLEKTQNRKSLNLAFNYQKDIYRIYLASGVKAAQKFAKNDELASDISHVYNHMEGIEKRVKEIEDTFNKDFMLKYSGFMYEGSEFMEKLLPLFQDPSKLDDDTVDELGAMGKSLQTKLEEVGELFGILGNLQVFIEDVEESEGELAEMLENLTTSITNELKEFGVDVAIDKA